MFATSRRLIGLGALALALGACHSTTAPTAVSATVRYQLDAPLCSSMLPVRLLIDGVVVATDTFAVNVSGTRARTSRDVATTAGAHTLAAQASIGAGTYVWPDRRVTLEAGTAFTDTLPFYCS